MNLKPVLCFVLIDGFHYSYNIFIWSNTLILIFQFPPNRYCIVLRQFKKKVRYGKPHSVHLHPLQKQGGKISGKISLFENLLFKIGPDFLTILIELYFKRHSSFLSILSSSKWGYPIWAKKSLPLWPWLKVIFEWKFLQALCYKNKITDQNKP